MPRALDSARLPSVTYSTEKHCCVPSFRTPTTTHHRQALLMSYSRTALFQVSLLPKHSQHCCVASALEAFTCGGAGQQFDRAPAWYQDLKQRQHFHGTPSVLLPDPACFRDHQFTAMADLLYLCTGTHNLCHRRDHRPEAVAGRWCSSAGCGAEHPALIDQEDKERPQTCDPALLCDRHSHDGLFYNYKTKKT